MSNDWQNGGFGIYVHWPFCEAKCPYCDFNSHVAREIDHSRWLRAYLRELDRYAAVTKGRIVSSIFFGGGTPSLMEPNTVGAVIEKIRALWPCANDLEITLEANPSSVEAGRFAGFHANGVNRISMGIQALNNHDLARLGRLHTVEEARSAFDIARALFDRVSFDLIYARQDQTPEDWHAELKEALSMAVDHISAYQLTIEDGTAFDDRYKRGKLKGLPDDDRAADMYEITQDVCAGAGFEAYEVSNHAKPGSECKHNLIYWRYGDYVGIGPGAHGRLSIGRERFATESYLQPEKWLKEVELSGGEKLREPLERVDQASEFLLMGLRLREGVSLARYTRLSGAPLNPDKIADLAELGLIAVAGDRLIASDRGRFVLNSLLAELLAD